MPLALQPVTAANFRNDINASGAITTGDVNLIKQNALSQLPSPVALIQENSAISEKELDKRFFVARNCIQFLDDKQPKTQMQNHQTP